MSATKIGVIGGTGLYDMEEFGEAEQITVDTPFGSPTSPITKVTLESSELYFIARHGIGHRFSPSEVNYRANIFALKSLGVSWCLSVSAVGSLAEQNRPGDVVIPDQFIDRTKGRESTFFTNGIVAHIPFATPFCPTLRQVLTKVTEDEAAGSDAAVHRDGTFLVMEGPAFSTRAESRMYRSWGATLIGMTNLPEAKLAREAEIAYATLALVTDYDSWRTDTDDVDIAEILATMKKNTELAKRVIRKLAAELPSHSPSALAADALKFAIITNPSQISEDTKKALEPLISRYVS